jgi:chromate reductase, NAD(P)H dehydrogenase (quinone)
MEKSLVIGALCGSLRKDSYNRKLLTIAQTLLPQQTRIEELNIAQLPFFNQDLESNPPLVVVNFRDKIITSDALLFVTPEYNYSIPGVLKNAIEWASRPYTSAVLNRKPAAIMGASNGQVGTARGQYHIRQMGVQTDMLILNRPEVMVSFAQEKFDANGNLTDEKTREKIKELLAALVDWTIKLQKVALSR